MQKENAVKVIIGRVKPDVNQIPSVSACVGLTPDLYANLRCRPYRSGVNPTYNKGFTLIELLVVVLIIGILAAVALPQYQRTVDKAAISCIMPVLKTLTDAQTAAALAQGGYPSGYFTFDELDVDIAVPNDSCKSSDICHGFKCAGKEFALVLRNDQTWANFYFWASSLERLFYYGGQNPHYQLQCKSNRCKQVARAFKARHVGNEKDVEYYSW